MFNIARNTFREILRSKYFSLILVLSIIFILSIFFLNTLSLHHSKYIVPDFGLSFIEVGGLFIILFLGNRMITREFEERTIYLTLSRPIHRGSIIIGKYLWFLAIITLFVCIESIVLTGLFPVFDISITDIYIVSIGMIFVKLAIILALMLFFSTFLSGGVATFMVLAAYIIGHNGYALLEYGIRGKNIAMEYIAQGVLTLFPNLSSINLRNSIHLEIPLQWSYVGVSVSWSLLYIVIILFLAQWIFRKRSFDSV